MTTELIQLAFDYESLDLEVRIVVQQRTSEIRERLRRTAQDIVEVGQRMIEVKDRLPHGQFGPWLGAEFGMSEGHARKMMQVYRAFGQNDHYDRFASTALYLLAAPGTPEEARIEAIEAASIGESISAKQAEEIVAKHKPAPASTPAKKPPVRREADELDDEPLSDYEAQIAAQRPGAVPPALTPLPSTSAPTSPAEVIAELPAAAPVPPPMLVPLTPIAAADTTHLRQAVALVALLDQALLLATMEIERLQRDLPGAPVYTLPDAAVEQAARIFLASPVVRGQASFLAMSAQEAFHE